MKESKICVQCEKTFFRKARMTNGMWRQRRYCSRGCYGKACSAAVRAEKALRDRGSWGYTGHIWNPNWPRFTNITKEEARRIQGILKV